MGNLGHSKLLGCFGCFLFFVLILIAFWRQCLIGVDCRVPEDFTRGTCHSGSFRVIVSARQFVLPVSEGLMVIFSALLILILMHI